MNRIKRAEAVPCRILGGALIVLASVFASQVLAQAFPSKRMTAIVPYAPGGVTDVMTRVLAEEMQKRHGQPVVVDNKPGGGASVGALALMKSPADGHTFMFVVNINASYAVFTRATSYDFERDLAPVAAAFWAPYVLIVNPQVPARSMRELVAYAKANPGKLNFASNPNSSQLLDAMDLLRKLGVDMTMVTYKGGAEALRGVLANESQLYFGSTLGLDQMTKEGRVVPLAVTSDRSFPRLPNLPTIAAEAGIDFNAFPIYGYATTVGTPAPVIDRLNRIITEIVNSAPMSDRLRSQSYEPMNTTPAEWGALLRQESRRVRTVADALGIKPQ